MLLYSVYGGSRLYNLQNRDSDWDMRGVFIEPAHVFFSLDTLDYYEDTVSDTVMYSLRRFIILALKNNPNTLELLFAPTYAWLVTTNVWHRIYDVRRKFLSEKAVKAYRGFLLQEYDTIKKEYNAKRASHVYRLAYNLAQLKSTQNFNPSLSGNIRYTALGIKFGGYNKEEAFQEIDDLLLYCENRKQSHLPSEPDYDTINTLVTDIQTGIFYEQINYKW